MRKITFVVLSISFFLLFTISVRAQETTPKKTSTEKVVDDEGPLMLKFEPDFNDQNEKKKAEIAITRGIIETMDISERKRLRLLRDLYKNGVSKRLQKVMLVENTFEDEDGDIEE